MALSGSFSGTIRRGYDIKVNWTAEQDYGKNTSTITCKLYFINDYAIEIGGRTNSITIAGQKFNIASGAINTTETHYIGQAVKTIGHNSDGSSPEVILSAVFNIAATLSGVYYENITASGKAVFTTIPRVSKVTLGKPSQFIGQSVRINTNRKSAEFKHTLWYAFEGGAKTKIAESVGDYYDWLIPASFYAKIPDKKEGDCVISCDTYYGAALIGSSETTLKALCDPVKCAPSITFNSLEEMYQPLKSLSLGENVFVWRASEIKASYSGVSIKNSAKFAYVELVIGDFAPETDNPADTSVIFPRFVNNQILDRFDIPGGSYTATLTVCDSRGFSFSQSKKVTMLPYSNPKILCDVGRVNNFESETEVVPGGEISVFKGKSGAVSFKYAVASPGQTPESYTEFSRQLEGGKITGDKVTLTLDNTKEWDVHIVLSDGMSAPQTRVYRVFRGVPLMFIDADTGDLEIMGKLKSKGLDYKKETLTLNGFTVNVARSGNTVQVNTEGKMNQIPDTSSWGVYKLFTLPEGYRPLLETETPLVCDGGNSDWQKNYHIWADAQGDVRIRTRANPISGWRSLGAGHGLWVSLTFITADDFPAE